MLKFCYFIINKYIIIKKNIKMYRRLPTKLAFVYKQALCNLAELDNRYIFEQE